MKQITICLLYFLAFAFAEITASDKLIKPKITSFAKSSAGFTPKNWRLIRKSFGDLNRDKKKDFVGILEYTNPNKQEFDFGPPRILLVAFRVANGYRLVARANDFVYRSGEGGVFGDPLESLRISRGTFKISFYGGSRWRWGYSYQFRYQKRAFYLIGYTSYQHQTTARGSQKEDYNLLTGMLHITKINEKGKKTLKKLRRGKKPLVRLQDIQATAKKKQF